MTLPVILIVGLKLRCKVGGIDNDAIKLSSKPTILSIVLHSVTSSFFSRSSWQVAMLHTKEGKGITKGKARTSQTAVQHCNITIGSDENNPTFSLLQLGFGRPSQIRSIQFSNILHCKRQEFRFMVALSTSSEDGGGCTGSTLFIVTTRKPPNGDWGEAKRKAAPTARPKGTTLIAHLHAEL